MSEYNPVGGRGKVAPYKTTHVRVPVDLKPQIEEMVAEYKKAILEGRSPVVKATENDQGNGTSVDDAIEVAKSILAQRKSARLTCAKLLTALYEVEVDPEKLKS